MNPLNGDNKKPHIYTQEEALEFNQKVNDLSIEVRKQKDENKELTKKFDIVLEMLTKEQLIEFIHKTM